MHVIPDDNVRHANKVKKMRQGKNCQICGTGEEVCVGGGCERKEDKEEDKEG